MLHNILLNRHVVRHDFSDSLAVIRNSSLCNPVPMAAPVNDALVLGFVMQEPGRERNVLGVCLAAWR